MKRLPATDFLRYASGIALIICSIALLVFSVTSTTAKAGPTRAKDEYQAVGAVIKDGKIQVIGYKLDPYTNKGDVVILGSY